MLSDFVFVTQICTSYGEVTVSCLKSKAAILKLPGLFKLSDIIVTLRSIINMGAFICVRCRFLFHLNFLILYDYFMFII